MVEIPIIHLGEEGPNIVTSDGIPLALPPVGLPMAQHAKADNHPGRKPSPVNLAGPLWSPEQTEADQPSG